MRNLTIKRNKAFDGCAVKVYVYVEDLEKGDLMIDGVKCSLLGKLKNGEEKTFQISEEVVNIYAFYNYRQREKTFAFYKIPAGTSNYRLTGKIMCDIPNSSFGSFKFDQNR